MIEFKFGIFQKTIIILSVTLIAIASLTMIKPPAEETAKPEESALVALTDLATPAPIMSVDGDEKQKLLEESKININTASIEDLMTVPSVGEGKARRIVEYREKNRNGDEPVFKTLTDLTNVSGFGEKTLERLIPHITVGWDVMQANPENPEADDDNDLVNINTANAERLQNLSGVGPSTAEAIIKYREENGPFLKPEDLMNVPRIGQARFDAWKDLVTVGDVTSADAKKSLTKPGKVEKLNLNQATLEQLMELPGIGQQYAATILAFRAKKKKLASVDELLEIKGFGKIKLDRIRPLITVQ